METGLEVARGLREEGFEYNLATFKLFLESPNAVMLWTIPLLLAIILRFITHFYHHQLIFPAYFFCIPIIFYSVVLISNWNLADLRQKGWIFDVGSNSQSWWKFYTYFVSCVFFLTDSRLITGRPFGGRAGVRFGWLCRHKWL